MIEQRLCYNPPLQPGTQAELHPKVDLVPWAKQVSKILTTTSSSAFPGCKGSSR
jgi:hypothetical protein